MSLIKKIKSLVLPAKGFDSKEYWERRYSSGGSSGPGSHNHLARFKARVINAIVRDNEITTVAEFGCGDGNQLALAEYPSYVGIDISDVALQGCRRAFSSDPSKRFIRLEDSGGLIADMALSLDVIYHLTEDEAFEAHIHRLFSSAQRMVVIYSSNMQDPPSGPAHVRHREFTKFVATACPEWHLREVIKNEYPYVDDYRSQSFSDFYIYEKLRAAGGPYA